jgi:hypothetical protein
MKKRKLNLLLILENTKDKIFTINLRKELSLLYEKIFSFKTFT